MQLTFDMVPTAWLFIPSESNLLLCLSQTQLRRLDALQHVIDMARVAINVVFICILGATMWLSQSTVAVAAAELKHGSIWKALTLQRGSCEYILTLISPLITKQTQPIVFGKHYNHLVLPAPPKLHRPGCKRK